MRNAVQRAWKLVVATVVVCAFVPAGRADAALVCGYVRVQLTTVPLVTMCAPGSCTGLSVGPTILGPTETYVCVTV